MDSPYTCLANLADEITPPADGTLSRTVHQDEHLKVVLFGFSAGQELSEHTASVPAVIHILSGEADISLGSDKIDAKPGTWIHMAANLSHSIKARTAVVMLLLMLKSAKG